MFIHLINIHLCLGCVTKHFVIIPISHYCIKIVVWLFKLELSLVLVERQLEVIEEAKLKTRSKMRDQTEKT